MLRMHTLLVIIYSLLTSHYALAVMRMTEEYPLVAIEQRVNTLKKDVSPISFRLLNGMGNTQCPYQGLQYISVMLNETELEEQATVFHVVAITPQAQEVTVVTREIISGRHDYRMRFNAGDCTSSLLIRFE